MTETKYGKCFIEYDPKRWPPMPKSVAGKPDRTIVKIDNHIAEGCFYYMIHWITPSEVPFTGIGHPPHIHKEHELLIHIGTNPDDPMDLGAEVEMYMGEEMERHVFNRSTVIWIPGGLLHAPLRPLKCSRPYIVIQVNQDLDKTEKYNLDILPKEMRDKVDLSLVKDVGF